MVGLNDPGEADHFSAAATTIARPPCPQFVIWTDTFPLTRITIHFARVLLTSETRGVKYRLVASDT
jgi:hypothetical protein